MHWQTRRMLCRTAFILFALVPTLLVAAAILRSESSGHWADRISNLTGLRATVGSAAHPRPGVTRLAQLQLVDEETGPVAHIAGLEIVSSSRGATIHAASAELQLEQLAVVHRLVHDQLLRRPLRIQQPTVARFDRLTLVASTAGAAPVVLRDVAVRLQRRGTQSRLAIELRCSGQPPDEPVELVLARTAAEKSVPATSWFVKTHGTPLPCRLLSGHVFALQRFGADCHFDGVLWASRQQGRWTVEANGTVSGIDLQQLVGRPFGHVLQGRVTVQLQRARIDQGRLVDAAGAVAGGSGTIGAELLQSAAEHLGFRLAQGSGERNVPFSRLAFGFLIDRQRLVVRGQADSSGAILVDRSGRPLVVEAAQPKRHVLELVRTLVADAQLHVPLTAETAPLLSLLPLPHAAGTDSDATTR